MNSLDDLLETDSPVRILDAFVDKALIDNPDLFPDDGRSGPGRPAYPPKVMLKLLIYGYMIGAKSSRRLEAEAARNREAMWLMHGLTPDHKTIAEFRRKHGPQITALSTLLPQFLKKTGHISGKMVALDGTKVKAYAREGMLTQERLESRLQEAHRQMERYLAQLEQSDQEDERADEDQDDDDALLEVIEQLSARIEELERQLALVEEKPQKRVSATDPEARAMKLKKQKLPAYNVQLAVDEEHHLLVASEVTDEPVDQEQLAPMHERVTEVLGEAPEEITADTAYCDYGDIQTIEEKSNTQCYIPENDTRAKRQPVTFRYLASEDQFECSAGRRLVAVSKQRYHKDKQAFVDTYRATDCPGCPLQKLCTSAKSGYRTMKVFHGAEWREEYRERMQTDYARERVERRMAVVEHVAGTIKAWMGYVPLFVRGIRNVQTDVSLYSMGYNLKRISNMAPVSEWLELIKDHLAANLDVFDFSLSRAEHDRITRPSVLKTGLATVRGRLG